MTKNKSEIRNKIYAIIFWIIVGIGILSSYNFQLFWRIILYIWLTMQFISLYGHIRKYIDISKRKQTDYNDFKKTVHDWYQKEYQYQSPIKRTEISISSAYRLMNLELSDDNDTIKKRYRQLAMQWHPDKFANDTVQKQETANRNFQKLTNAYTVIKKYKNFV